MRHSTINVHAFIRAIADVAIARLNDDDKTVASDCFLTYGAGMPGLRGVTYYKAWQRKTSDKPSEGGTDGNTVPFVEVCAMGQSDSVQLAGTTIHEIGHVLAGHQAGHGKEWKLACDKLGLRKIKAAGTVYHMANFHPDIRDKVYYLIQQLEREEPAFMRLMGKTVKPAPCPAGIGTRGGKSRGKGSGSRMLKFACNDCNAIWRMSGKYLDSVTACPCCQSNNLDKPE